MFANGICLNQWSYAFSTDRGKCANIRSTYRKIRCHSAGRVTLWNLQCLLTQVIRNGSNLMCSVQIEEQPPTTPALERLETLITAATMTSEPIDTSDHVKLFTSSSEFYEQRGSLVPDSLQPLDMSTAMQSLNAVASPNWLRARPAFNPARQFGPRPTQSATSSPGSANGLGKVGSTESEVLLKYNESLCSLQRGILDPAFHYLNDDAKCKKLDEALAFVTNTLVHLRKFEERASGRAKMADRRAGKCTPDIAKTSRDCLAEKLRTFHGQLLLLDAAISNKPPKVINAGKVERALIFQFYSMLR